MYCFDCGTKLVGYFCHNCGRKEPKFSKENLIKDQEVKLQKPTVAQIFKDANDNFVIAAVKYRDEFGCTFTYAMKIMREHIAENKIVIKELLESVGFNKIEAIKKYRILADCGLKTACERVKNYILENNIIPVPSTNFSLWN